jgi:hypothetical protein
MSFFLVLFRDFQHEEKGGNGMTLRTCVTPEGEFVYGIHKPRYRVMNLRQEDKIESLGPAGADHHHDNRENFPPVDVLVDQGDWVYEIANAFPFRGTTYISRSWADSKAETPTAIRLAPLPEVSLSGVLKSVLGDAAVSEAKLAVLFKTLPTPIRLALATSSTDAEELEQLARLSCELVINPDTERPLGIRFREDKHGNRWPVIHDHSFFDAVGNNPSLPDDYKEAMMLRPGIQGTSEIVGEYLSTAPPDQATHVFEYLRRNSYIPWGHYAANMANDAVRYRIGDLSASDFTGLRHLYYQRTYVRLAEELGVPIMARWKCLRPEEIEELRQKIIAALIACEAGFSSATVAMRFCGTVWGWNYGFACAPHGYRLHASHQQIHQQYALVPAAACGCRNGVEMTGNEFHPFNSGDMIAEFINQYHQQTGNKFFQDYLRAINNNRRMDGRSNGADSLIVYDDAQVMLFVPKAQTSQWELQLITKNPVGNIIETDLETRNALDKAILIALRILTGLGAQMITTIEFAKRFSRKDNDAADTEQHLLYVLLPRLPYSPGGFSEAQLRWINGHYPEDFAAACREQLADLGKIA